MTNGENTHLEIQWVITEQNDEWELIYSRHSLIESDDSTEDNIDIHKSSKLIQIPVITLDLFVSKYVLQCSMLRMTKSIWRHFHWNMISNGFDKVYHRGSNTIQIK